MTRKKLEKLNELSYKMDALGKLIHKSESESLYSVVKSDAFSSAMLYLDDDAEETIYNFILNVCKDELREAKREFSKL